MKNFLKTPEEKFNYFFQSALFGIFFLKLFLTCFPAVSSTTQNDYFKTYALSWIFCPLGGLTLSFMLEKIRFHWHSKEFPYYTYAHFLNFTLILFILGPGFNLNAPSQSIIFLSIQTLIFLIGLLLKKPQTTLLPRIFFYLSIVLLFVFTDRLNPNWLQAFQTWSIWNYLFFITVIFIFYKNASSPKTSNRVFLNLIVLAATAYAVIDPHLDYLENHTSYYLGPLADLLAGKSLLVNITAQYGIFVFYFLKLFFIWLPLGYKSFTLVGNFLLMIQFFVYYFIVRQLFPSKLYSLLCLFALLLFNYFDPQAIYSGFLPSVGPLRFGFIFILTALALLRNRYPAQNRYFWILEGLTVATAFFWSFEVCFYTLPAYLTLVAFESLNLEEKISFNWSTAAKRLSWLFFFMAVILVYLYFDIFLRSQDFPHWSYYFDLIFYYKNGYGALPMPAMGCWWIIIGILYFSFFAILGIALQPQKKTPVHLNAAVLLTVYGIFQFFYYLGRAHENNLYNISMPSLTLLFYWLYLFKTSEIHFIPVKIKNTGFALVIFLTAFFSSASFSNALTLIHNRSLPLSGFIQNMVLALKDLPRNDEFALEAGRKMSQYSPHVKYPVYFFGKNDLDVSLYTGRSKAYPYNDDGQAFMSPAGAERILSFDPRLVPGDYVYLSQDYSETLEAYLFTLLSKKYKLELVEKGKIAVFRVKSVLEPNLNMPQIMQKIKNAT